ncbi:retrovirus-related pol polyprotein from transposon TNT 1-94 [Tanacetum coccineum]
MRVFGYKEVTRWCLEALELKGGNGGTCKLLGDVIEVLGCLLEVLASEEDSDPEQAQKDKDMQKNLALIAKYFKKTLQSYNNTSELPQNTVKRECGYYSKETRGPCMFRLGYSVLNCKELGHYAKECRKPKRVKGLHSMVPNAENSGRKVKRRCEAIWNRFKAFNDRTVDYDKLERKLNETLGLLAQKEIDIKEGLKVKAYEISVVKEKHDELVKQSLLTKSHYEGLVKEKTKVITDLKLKEEKDIDKMISMENQNDSFAFVHELKQEMHADLKYVESLEDELDELESDKAEFSNMYDMLLECDCLAQKLSEQTEFVNCTTHPIIDVSGLHKAHDRQSISAVILVENT